MGKLKDKLDEGKKKEEPVKEASVKNNNFDGIRGLMSDINKHYKKSIVKLGSDIPPIRKVPFGEPALDYVHDGGIPIGRFTEFLGQEHSGKTRNSLVAMQQFQQYCFNCHTAEAITAVWKEESEKSAKEKGAPVLKSCKCSNCSDPRTNIQVFIDKEGTCDKDFMAIFGIDVNGVIYLRTELPSESVDIADTFLRNPDIGLIVFDSVGSMGSDKEVGNAIVDDKMNQNALFLNKAMRKWQSALNSNTNYDDDSGTTMIVINQSYSSIGVHSYEVAQGGRGLRHGKGLSVKTQIREKTYNDAVKKDFMRGVHIRVTNEKNKTGMPYRRFQYYLNLDPNDAVGYCHTDIPLQILELGLMLGMFRQAGAWLYYEDGEGNQYKWNGKSKMIEELRVKPDILNVIKTGVYTHLGV